MDTSLRQSAIAAAPPRSTKGLWAAWSLAAGILGGLAYDFAAVPAQTPPSSARSFSSMVHWSNARHDWLVVYDAEAGELVVYDARDGRPLRRVTAERGGTTIEGIVASGNLLIATGRERPSGKVWRLPDLEPVNLAGR